MPIIIALGSTNKGNVIPGVAIATALMPPLCTAGYGLATWQLNYFFGASYLFIINSIYIAFATFIGVKLMKYKRQTSDNARARRVRRIVYSLAVLTMLPSIYLTYNMLRDSRFTMNADRFIQHECDFPGTQVLSRKAYMDHGQRHLVITLIGRPLPADSLHLALAAKLKYYGLAGTSLTFIQGAGYENNDDKQTAVSDIYAMTQATISRQQGVIDSLRSVLRAERASTVEAPEISPEIKILFPKIKDIAVATTVFSTPGEQKVDTANVALIRTQGRFDRAERNRLSQYLQTRLRLDHVEVVEL